MIFLHGIGHFHPENVIDNEFLENLDIGCESSWTLERVGIRTRRTVLPLDYLKETKNRDISQAHEASLYTNSQTAARAAEMALSRAGVSKAEIGWVISGSCSPQHSVPAEACTVAAELGIDCPAFDLNSACSSALAHLYYLNSVKPEILPDYVLLVSPENNTRVIDYSDRTTAVLWGDCSSAMVVSMRHPGRVKIRDPFLDSSPCGWEAVKVPPDGHFTQVGRTVQTYAIKKSVFTIRKFREALPPQDWASLGYIGHQANLTMLQSVCRHGEISADRHLFNVDAFGNGGAAGAPSVLSQNWENLQDGSRIIMAVVGAGLTWGGALLQVGESP